MMDLNEAGPQEVFEDAEARRERVLKAVRQRIRAFVKDLYPNADTRHDVARIGNILGEPGESMVIQLRGDDAGLWYDHATGERGDIFTLWGVASGLDVRTHFAQILDECDQWAGGTVAPKVQATRVARKAKIHEAPKTKRRKTDEYIYYSPSRVPIGKVTRYLVLTEDGAPILDEAGRQKKSFSMYSYAAKAPQAPDPRPLMFQPEMASTQGPVVLVEGEKCASALMSADILATTAMGGANSPIEKTDWSPLAGREIILWPDNDPAGDDYMKRVFSHLTDLGCQVSLVLVPDSKPAKWDAADCIEAGEDPRELLGLAEAPPAPAGLPLLTMDELLDLPDPVWIIDQWIIDDGVSVFYGPAKTYKTFNVLDLALSVAHGVPWRGNKTVQVPVLYLLGEGMGSFKDRVHVWREKRSEGREGAFLTIPVGVPLGSPEGLSNLFAAIERMPEPPQLIVIDTLNRHFGPGDENSTQDMTRFSAAVDAIRTATRAHICIVHHSGKDGEKGARGSSVLRGAVDNEFQISRLEGTRICTIKCTAARHADEPEPMQIEMVNAEAVNPKTGVVMSSLLPVLMSNPLPAQDSLKGDQRVLDALQDGLKSVKELGDKTGLSRSRLSNILRKMEQNKEISAVYVGRAKFYQLLADEGAYKDV